LWLFRVTRRSPNTGSGGQAYAALIFNQFAKKLFQNSEFRWVSRRAQMSEAAKS
jgi:hypothetical protein